MDERGKVLSEGRIDNTPATIATMLAPSQGNAQVVLEACGLWPWVYDLPEPHGVGVTLAHPQSVKAMAHARSRPTRWTPTPGPLAEGRLDFPSLDAIKGFPQNGTVLGPADHNVLGFNC
jgi:hypothetical protein